MTSKENDKRKRPRSLDEYAVEKMLRMERRIADLESAYRNMAAAFELNLDAINGAEQEFSDIGARHGVGTEHCIERLHRKADQAFEHKHSADKAFWSSEEWWISNGR